MTRGLLRASLRTLLMQASWNYDRLVGLGFATSIEPLLRWLPGGPGGERYRAALARAAQFFNAHPYLAGLAVGAVARAEFEGAAPAHVERLRGALIAPLGSVGDRLVWAGVLPATVALGLALAVLVEPWWGAVAFLAAYNGVHFVLRVWAVRAGWREGTAVARALTAAGLQRGLGAVGPAAGLLLGFAIPPVTAWLAADLALEPSLGLGVVAAAAIVLARWIWPALGGVRFGLLVAGAAIAVGWV